MKFSKFAAEAFITIAILYMIYAFMVKAPAEQQEQEQTAMSGISSEEDDFYEAADRSYSIEELNGMAKIEADKIMSTGDSSRLKEEWEQEEMLP